MDKSRPKVNPVFRDRQPPLTKEEKANLRKSIQEVGCLQPVVVWDGVLIDGHHRIQTCIDLGVPYETREMEFADEADALYYIDRSALSRRNLSPKDLSVCRGRVYNGAKRQGQRTDLTSCQVGTKSDSTAGRIAKATDVSERTIKRDGKRAEVVDRLLSAVRTGKTTCEDVETAKHASQERIDEAAKIEKPEDVVHFLQTGGSPGPYEDDDARGREPEELSNAELRKENQAVRRRAYPAAAKRTPRIPAELPRHHTRRRRHG